MRRRTGDWMQLPIDNHILETLEDSGLRLTPAVLAENIGYSRSEVNTRLSELVENGLASRPKRGYYEISNDGLLYLAGELDASEKSD